MLARWPVNWLLPFFGPGLPYPPIPPRPRLAPDARAVIVRSGMPRQRGAGATAGRRVLRRVGDQRDRGAVERRAGIRGLVAVHALHAQVAKELPVGTCIALLYPAAS
jgi:hypothetical protein